MDWKRYYKGKDGTTKECQTFSTPCLCTTCTDAERYAVVFRKDNDNYCCHVYARSEEEALGAFFRLHANVCYMDVLTVYVEAEN